MKNLFVLLLFFFTANANAQNWEWAKSAGGYDWDEGLCVAVDSKDFTYITGGFASLTINMSGIILSLPNSGSSYDMFIAKYDPAGNIVWAKNAQGYGGADGSLGIAVDAKGYSYITGYFISDSIKFDNITLYKSTPADIYSDLFLAKYDPDGNAVWAKSVGGNKYEEGRSITLDKKGKLFITGYYNSSSINFDTTTILNTNSSYDLFIAKFDTSGNFIWAKGAKGNGMDNAESITADAFGNVYITGNFTSDTLKFGSLSIINSGHKNIFISKLDSFGNFEWARVAGGSGWDYGDCITVDSLGHSYVLGKFSSPSISFDSITLINSNYSNVFITKFNANGNVVWSMAADNSFNVNTGSITIYKNEILYITGQFEHLLSFGNATVINSGGNTDIFVFKFDSTGNILGATSSGYSEQDDNARSIAVDTRGNPCITGYFNGAEISFGNIVLSGAGGRDIFITKLDSSIGVESHEIKLPDNFLIAYPNPTNETLIVSFENSFHQNSKLELINSIGKKVFEKSFGATQCNQLNIDVHDFSSGIYFLSLKSEKQFISEKIVIVH